MSELVLSEDQAKKFVHSKNIGRLDQVLTLLATNRDGKTINELRKTASVCGLRSASKWNISDILRKSNGCAILVGKKWEITDEGCVLVAKLADIRLSSTVVRKSVADVRKQLCSVGSIDAKQFIEEAVCCFENGQLRAAVVFSWIGAVSIMQNKVFNEALQTFNKEMRRRDAKWKDVRNCDEFWRVKEHDFLDILEAIGLIGKNVKQTLQNQCLSLRNACGHPNSLRISENNVAAHIDTLILNVYSKFL